MQIEKLRQVEISAVVDPLEAIINTMLRSSLGFHTMTLSMVLLQQDTSQLFDDLKKYKQETGAIREYPDGHGN